jgi:hypothetical protein
MSFCRYSCVLGCPRKCFVSLMDGSPASGVSSTGKDRILATQAEELQSGVTLLSDSATEFPRNNIDPTRTLLNCRNNPPVSASDDVGIQQSAAGSLHPSFLKKTHREEEPEFLQNHRGSERVCVTCFTDSRQHLRVRGRGHGVWTTIGRRSP